MDFITNNWGKKQTPFLQISYEEFDEWAVKYNYLDAIPVGTAVGSPNWIFRREQRQYLKNEINLGAESDAFPHWEKFKVFVSEHGKSFEVKSLYQSMIDVGEGTPGWPGQVGP